MIKQFYSSKGVPVPYLQFLLLFFILLTAFPSRAQAVEEEWTRRFEVPERSVGSLAGSVMDAEGNVFLTGYKEPVDAGNGHIITLKYSPEGELLWSSQHQANYDLANYEEEARGLVLDGAGGVYVAGVVRWRENGKSSDSYMATLLKLDAADGKQLWSTTHGRDREQFRVTAITVDASGGVYLAGSVASGHYSDYALAKFNAANGAPLWEQQFDGAAGMDDVALDVEVDNIGGVYLTGSSREKLSANDDLKLPVPVYTIVTIKYDAGDGSVAWIGKYGGDGRGNRQGYRLALDDTGVYVVGSDEEFMRYIITLKYDREAGEELWVARFYDGSRDHTGRDIALDGAGGVYVTGISVGAMPRYATIKYNATDGSQAWAQVYNGEFYGFNEVSSIAIGNDGGVYVSGVSGSPSGLYHFLTIRYNGADGEQVWADRFTEANGDMAGPTVILVGQAGEVYLAGTAYYHNDQVTRNLFLARYEPTGGEIIWSKKYGWDGLTDRMGTAVAVDAAGNVYTAGTGEERYGGKFVYITRHDATGRQLWRAYYKDEVGSGSKYIALDSAGGVFVATDGGQLLKLNASDGTLTWKAGITERAGAKGKIRGLVRDEAGGVYVTGKEDALGTGERSELLTVKFDPATGNRLWEARHGGQAGNDGASALVLDGKGSLLVTGYVYNSDNTIQAITVKYDGASGEELWLAALRDVVPSDIAVDHTGGVYLAATRAGVTNIITIRYNATDGTQDWVASYGTDGQRDVAGRITTDQSGGVYVAGLSQVESGNLLLTTLKYKSEDGTQLWARPLYEIPHGATVEGIKVGNGGSVYLAGNVYLTNDASKRGFALARYNSETGALLWTERSDKLTGQDSEWALGFTLDEAGHLYLTGNSQPPAGEKVAFTAKYSQNLHCQPITPQAIAGPAKVRAGQGDTFFELAGTGGSSFDWSISGREPVPFTGQGTSHITAQLQSSGFYEVHTKYGNDCSTYTSKHKVAVYNPDNRVVAAAGWLHSPQNSQLAYMQQEGRGYFGLAVQYRKGTEQVQGQATFHFRENDLLFQSTSLEAGRLIVFGQEANFKGRGTINGREGYGFLISLVNHALNVTNPNDRLRLMIWEEASGKVLYDNQAGDEEEATALHRIGMGAMVLYNPRQPDLRAKAELEALGIELPGTAPVAGLRAYPTAFADRTTVSFSHEVDGGYSLELYDLGGRLIRKIAEGTAEAGRTYEFGLEGDGMEKGMYLVRLTTDSGTQTVRVLKQ